MSAISCPDLCMQIHFAYTSSMWSTGFLKKTFGSLAIDWLRVPAKRLSSSMPFFHSMSTAFHNNGNSIF